MTLSIADLGVGNIKSVQRILEFIGVEANIVKSPNEAINCSKLILPGVGAFDSGMAAIEENNWTDTLNILAHERSIPILGICMGMQLLCRGSEEGVRPGLGWVPADIVKFKLDDMHLKIPHMGWAFVKPVCENLILPLELEEQRFYHTHKYHAVCDTDEFVLATATYGYEFATIIKNNNIYGVQFHPEKSHSFGMGLFKRFAELEC